MEYYPRLDNDIYNVVDRVMRPLALRQTRRPRSDRGIQKARHSVSSSSTHHFGSSSHQEDDDDNEGTSRANTPSLNTYLNSLQPLTHQIYGIPTSSQQTANLLFERQTTLLNRQQQMHEEVRGGFKSCGKALEEFLERRKIFSNFLSKNLIRGRKIGMIWSFSLLEKFKSGKIPFVCEDSLTIVGNFENLAKLCERKGDEFILNHERDENITGIFSLKSDLTIKV
nr:hypothetical protein [Tanacetum cinerariifolium]